MSWTVVIVAAVILLNAIALVGVVFVGIPTYRRHSYEFHLWDLRELVAIRVEKHEIKDPERALRLIKAVDARLNAARFMTPYEAWSFRRCLSQQGLRIRSEPVDVRQFEDDEDLVELANQVRGHDRQVLRSGSLSGWALYIGQLFRPRSAESDDSLVLYAAIRGVRGRHPVRA